MKHLKYFSIVVFSLMLLSTFILAQEDMMQEKEKKMMDDDMMQSEMMHIDKNDSGVAIKGYDPVAYFTDDKAMMGNPEYTYNWGGAEWYFTSEDHLSMFMESPEKYAPKYGGFCAMGMTMGKYFSTEPTVWKIVDGKLYLNKNEEVGKKWKMDIGENIEKADENWMKMETEMMDSEM